MEQSVNTHSGPSDSTGQARQADQPSQHACPPGAIAGAVLRSARRSAALTPAELAAIAQVSEITLRLWEDGVSPLALVPMSQVSRLENGLLAAGADQRLVADISVGSWCDLLILAIATGEEDTSCLLADSLAACEAFGELLTWSISGQPPARHRAYADDGPLLPAADPSVVRGVRQILDARQPVPEPEGSARPTRP
jgi:DNA-binding transcriptional regulator YiaG